MTDTDGKKKENLHKGHRDRLRDKFIQHDIEVYEPHEVLELLLFYAYRQRDTNEIAHRLLNQFGTLSGVFEADVQSLMQVEGVGKETAVFLKLQSTLQRYYLKEKNDKSVKRKFTPEKAAEYIKTLFYGYTNEVFYMISLDSESRLISSNIITKGTVNSTAVYTREVVKKAMETNASYVILAHNHPNGVLLPSEQDKRTTALLQEGLSFINVRLIDHIIVSGDRTVSMRDDFKLIKL